VSTDSSLPDVMVKTRPKTRTNARTRRIPPYHVILFNDDHHTVEFVVDVLRKALGYTEERCVQLTLLAHHSGRAVVWTGPKEVAELKADQIRTFHQTLDDGRYLGPLGCDIEPACG
jgi:ATP-dependent Clp protease adaptor protein ClpS